jgi:hypothetical protein
MASGETLEEEHFDYDGPVALCGGGGGVDTVDEEYNARMAKIAEEQHEMGKQLFNFYKYGTFEAPPGAEVGAPPESGASPGQEGQPGGGGPVSDPNQPYFPDDNYLGGPFPDYFDTPGGERPPHEGTPRFPDDSYLGGPFWDYEKNRNQPPSERGDGGAQPPPQASPFPDSEYLGGPFRDHFRSSGQQQPAGAEERGAQTFIGIGGGRKDYLDADPLTQAQRILGGRV